MTPTSEAVPLPGIRNAEQLAQAVDDLEGRARARGFVANEDVARVHASIRALEPQLGRAEMRSRGRQLGERMRQLRVELEIKPVQDELERLLGEIRSAASPPVRDRLVLAYRAAARELPDAYRVEANTRLGEVLPARSAALP